MYPVRATKLYIGSDADGYSLDGYAVEYIDGYSADGYSAEGRPIGDLEGHERQTMIIGMSEARLARRHAGKLRRMCEGAEQQYDKLPPHKQERLVGLQEQLSYYGAIIRLMEAQDGYQDGSH